MKKTLCILLVFVLCFSLVACGGSQASTTQTAAQDKADDQSREEYKVPIILLHGRISNTEVFYGVHTGVEKDDNSCYGDEVDVERFTSVEDQRITEIDEGRLGAFLTDKLGYEKNVNIFAFNYPNEDMVAKNAILLEAYIDNLVASGRVTPQRGQTADKIKFILIGHSMGGLVSRYYIENMGGAQRVERLITICTPHYGSGLAIVGDETPGFNLIPDVFIPGDVDLRPKSRLFDGKEQKHLNVSFTEEGYGYRNQSEQLKGNHSINVPYYAIGGYDADSQDTLAPELRKKLKDGACYLVEFDRNIGNKEMFQKSINDALEAMSMVNFGVTSELELGDNDGDDVVDYMSQFAVNFDNNDVRFQKLEKTILILSAGHTGPITGLHTEIASEEMLLVAVRRCLNAENEENTENEGASVVAEGSCNENVRWTLYSNGVLSISGKGEMPDYDASEDVSEGTQPWNAYVDQITNILVENGVTSIGENAFEYCEEITNITIADSVETISDYAFGFTYNLAEINIPENVSHIGKNALPIGVQRIEVAQQNKWYCSVDGVLFNKDQTVLINYPAEKEDTEYVIPNSVTRIEIWAFDHSTYLEKLHIHAGVSSMGEDVRYEFSTGALFWDSSINHIEVDKNNKWYSTADGVLFDKAQNILLRYPEMKQETSYEVPDGVTTIGAFAFYYCDTLQQVALPQGVQVIGESAFEWCDSMEYILLPRTLRSVEDYAFYGCEALLGAWYLGTEWDWWMIAIGEGNDYLNDAFSTV